MKKILFLTPTLPFPPHSGGVIKSNKVVSFLSAQYDVAVACLLKNDDHKHITEFHQKYKLHDFISLELNVARNGKNFLLSGLTFNSFLNIFKYVIPGVILISNCSGIQTEFFPDFFFG